MNVDDRDGRRTVAALLGSTVAGLAAVGATLWVFNGVSVSPAVGAPQSISMPVSAETAIPDLPTTSTTTFVPPSPSATPFTAAPLSVHVAPAELPTMTAPVPGQVADPDPGASAGPTRPVTPPPPTSAPSAVVSALSLSCRRSGNRIVAGLSFRSTAAVPVSLMAGGEARQESAGPGAVTMSVAGKRGSFCLATVGTQRIGPMNAS